MNKNTSTEMASRSGSSSAHRILLPTTSPHWGALQAHAVTEPQHVVDKAAVIIQAMPDLGRDPERNTDEVNSGYAVPLVLNRGNTEGAALAEAFVEQARDVLGEASEHVAEAHRDIDAAEGVWTLPVTVDGRQLSRGGAAVELDEGQAAGARLEAGGDHSHLHRPMPAPLAVVGALAVTGIEFGALYAPVFNPGDLLSLLALVGFTVAVYAATHLVTLYTGRAIRALREFGKRREDQLDAGAAHLHSEAATGSGREESDAARSTGYALAGTAGPSSVGRWAKGAMVFWIALATLLAGFLVTVVGLRIDAMVLAIGRGPVFSALFGAFIGLVVLGILAALVWGFSRGSMLGRRLEHLAAVVDESADMVERHSASARGHLDAAGECLDEAATIIARGEEVHARHLVETIGAVQLAATVLHVRDVSPVPPERMIPFESAARRDVDGLLRQVGMDRAAESARISAIERRMPMVSHPHASHRPDRPGVVDLAALDPARLGARVVDDRRRLPRGLVIGGIALLVIAVIAAAIVVTAVGAHAAAPTSPAASSSRASASLVEGRDYSYLEKTDARPDRWSCDTPIDVGLAAGAPSGASAAVRTAVERIAALSGLPLRYGTPAAPQISVAYVPTSTVQRLGGGDAVGVAQTRADASGTYQHAAVDIAADAAVNVPGSATAGLVLLHELMHAVGLGHATATDEVMAPVLDAHAAPDLGRGDIAALQSVGCR